MIGESEKQIEQMNRISKENDELIRYVKDKVDNDFNKEAIKVGMTKLSIYQHNLEQIHKDFDDMKSDQLCVNYDEMQKNHGILFVDRYAGHAAVGICGHSGICIL